MLLFLIMGVVLVGLAIVFLALALKPAGDTGVNQSIAVLEAMTSAPTELTKELDKSFKERVFEPLLARTQGVGGRLTGKDTRERLTRKLELAGNPPGWTVDRILSSKVLGAIAGGVVMLLVSPIYASTIQNRLIMIVVGIAIGFFAPNFWLYQKSYDRQNQLQRELPDAIDLMTISVESGLAFDAALQQVSRNTKGPLSEEFARVLREMQIGQGRSAALRALSERSNQPEVRGFVTAMVQADAFGIPIAQVLRVQSHEMRVKRRQRAEEKAQQVPVKITIPLIFCILPTLFAAVMGPAAIRMMENFSGQ